MFKSIRVRSVRSAPTVYAIPEGATTLRGASLPAAVKTALKSSAFKGDRRQVLPVGDEAILVGIGKPDTLERNDVVAIGSTIGRTLDRAGIAAARIDARAIPGKRMKPEEAGGAIGEGLGLGTWRVSEFDGSATRSSKPHPSLSVTSEDTAFRKGLSAGLALAESVNETRRMAATPPNICNPAWVASEARKIARKTGLKCTVIGPKELDRLGMEGIASVGRGSATPPRMIILEYRPARAKPGAHVALVGKTMTYDSGGYSLKISGSMRGMKYDGNGGYAVLGAMHAIARRKPNVRVTAFLPCAENMVNGEAYRPDDIITLYNGVTVEVTNTDAEGRLILGDALAYACKKYKPTAIVDVATLTGGVVVALGKWSAGLFANNDGIVDKVQAAADRTGERVWRLPLWDDHRDFMRAKHADVWNSAPARDGHPIQGAAFLSYFVDESIPWAHLDIAGTSATDSETPVFVNGPTGFGVRLLTDFVEHYKP